MPPSVGNAPLCPKFLHVLKHFASLLFVLILPLLSGCERSATHRESSEELADKLAKLTFDQVIRLGSHHAESKLVMTSTVGGEEKVVSEDYELKWDSWEQYRYLVKKGDSVAMDVTVWQGKGFQRQSSGRIRSRERPDELNYYLRQTFTQWNSAVRPFKHVLLYEFDSTGDLEGRPADKYLLRLKQQIEPRPSRGNRLRQTMEHDKLEGAIWIDRKTEVPLQAILVGEYRVVRYSRRPGSPGEEAKHKIDFKLRRYDIGRRQLSEPPEAVARP